MLKNFAYISKTPSEREIQQPYILHVANIREQKGHVFLLESADKALHDHPAWQLVMVGAHKQDEWFEKFQAQLSQCIHKGRMHYLGAREDVASLMGHAGIGVMSSLSEGLPVTLLEFGMLGVPMVVTDVGACAMVIGNPEYVVPYGDVAGMAGALSGLMADEGKRLKAGKRFLEKISKEYDTKPIYHQLISVYNP